MYISNTFIQSQYASAEEKIISGRIIIVHVTLHVDAKLLTHPDFGYGAGRILAVGFRNSKNRLVDRVGVIVGV